jgi:DNA-binding GntR family transcriptional regulator
MLTFGRMDGAARLMALGDGFQATTYTPLRDEVLGTLRQALIGGRFSAGERIREVELASRLGVSRGTLREALRHLEQEGLLVTSPHRGTFVVNPSPKEIEDIYGLRIALESYAVEQAAQSADVEDLMTLQSVVDDFTELSATGRATLVPRLGLELQFHELLCEVSGNARLLRTWTELCAPLRLLLVTFNEPFLNSDEVAAEHQSVVDALRAGDGAAARATLTRHLEHSRDQMLLTLRSHKHADEDADSDLFSAIRS